nr:hypothetical protein [Clostridium perfringens]
MLKKFSNKKITALMVVLAMVFSFILPIPVKAAEISETKNSNVTEKTDKKLSISKYLPLLICMVSLWIMIMHRERNLLVD